MNKITLFFCLLFYGVIQAQEVKVTVLDKTDGQPLPAVHVCTETRITHQKGFFVTDKNGIVQVAITEKAQAAISFIGYKTLVSEIEPGKSYVFKLEPTAENITEVVVTGQMKPVTKDKSIYNVQVVNKNDINNKAANTLSDLLSNELSIKVENNGILGSGIRMQGLSGEHVKILIDGVPVIGRQNGSLDLNQLNLQNVDHIEIVEGPMSVIYGSNALAGAINIITKKNTRPRFSTGINGYYESVGIYNMDALFTKNYKNHYFNITGGRHFFDGYKTRSFENKSDEITDSEEGDDFDPKQKYFATIDYGYHVDKFKLYLTQDIFNEELRNLSPIYWTPGEQISDTIIRKYPYVKDEYHYTNRATSKMDFQYTIDSNTMVSILGSYSYYNKIKNTWRTDLISFEKIMKDSSENDTSVFDTYMSRGMITHTFRDFEILAGYDINFESGKGKRIPELEHINEYAAFIDLNYSLMPNMQLQGGGRLIKNSKYKAPFVYSLNFKYNPVENLSFRASYGIGFRSPSLKELYLNFVDSNHEIVGNPNLEAEHSKSFNFSVNYSISKWEQNFDFALKLFHTQLENKIDFLYYENQPTKADYINVDGIYKTIGGQFDLSYRFHPRFKLTAGIHLLGNSKLIDLKKFDYSEDYTLTLNYSNLKYLFKWNIYYKYTGEESTYTRLENDSGIIDYGFRTTEGYHNMDLTLNKPFFNDKLDIAVGVKNLFDVTVITSTGSNSGEAHSSNSNGTLSWGRTYFIKLLFNLNRF